MPTISQPTIENTPRKVSYTATASTGPFEVPFPLYDGTGADLYITLDGVETTATWTYSGTLVTGAFGQPNAYTNGSVTFASAITGALVIRGRRAPRRTNQFLEGVGVPARDMNAALNEIAAVQRETFDRFDEDVGDIETVREELAQAVLDAQAAQTAAEAAETNAETAASNAEDFATSAQGYATAAATSALLLASPDLGAFPDAFTDSFDLGTFP